MEATAKPTIHPVIAELRLVVETLDNAAERLHRLGVWHAAQNAIGEAIEAVNEIERTLHDA